MHCWMQFYADKMEFEAVVAQGHYGVPIIYFHFFALAPREKPGVEFRHLARNA